MDKKQKQELTKRYQNALETFVEKVKKDVNVVAVIISGSLAYDQVWEKSDIDTTIVVRDQALKKESFCLVEDDITINVTVAPRSGFKRFLETLCGGSFLHSYYAKATIVYSTDDSLYEYLEEFKTMGKDDVELTIFFQACELHYFYEKSLKWITVKEDPLYAQYYLLKAAEVIARIEVCLAGEIPTREAIVNAKKIHPEAIAAYYDLAMSHHYTKEEIMEAIHQLDEYLRRHIDVIKKPILNFMSDGEMKTVTMITKFFQTESHFIIGMLDYLADLEVIAKVTQTIRLTPKSKPAVEEITYQYIEQNYRSYKSDRKGE